MALASFDRYVLKVSDYRAKLCDYRLRRAEPASRWPSAHRPTTATTPPPFVVLDDAGKSKHLRFKGAVGGGSMEVTDVDLRDANSGDRRFFASLQSQRFVTVDAAGLGNLDRRYCVGFDVPAITDLSVPPMEARATPPRTKKKSRPG